MLTTSPLKRYMIHEGQPRTAHSLTLVEAADALVLDGLLDAVQRARVHGRLPGGGLGLRLEAHLQERESRAN